MAIDDDIAGYRFEDLKAAGILKSRTDLARKQKDHGFPLPVKLGKRQAWFPKTEVRVWLNKRIAERPAPSVVPDPPAAVEAAPTSKRPRKPAAARTVADLNTA